MGIQYHHTEKINDMYPTFESGSVIAFQEITDPSFYVPRHTYILGSKHFKLLGRLQPASDVGRVKSLVDNRNLKRTAENDSGNSRST